MTRYMQAKVCAVSRALQLPAFHHPSVTLVCACLFLRRFRRSSSFAFAATSETTTRFAQYTRSGIC
jgi:hypothetical protein